MCGRFTLTSDLNDFMARLDVIVPDELLHPRLYNIAPSQPLTTIVADPQRHVEISEWGFLPGWAETGGKYRPVINARAESVADKPFFRNAFRSGRCVIPADGFFEWQKQKGGKQPYWIHLKSREIFGFAGLRSERHDKDGTLRITSAIITVPPNELMEPIHNRMPAILPQQEIERWLDPKTSPDELQQLLIPFPSEELQADPVSTYVNSPANTDERTIRMDI